MIETRDGRLFALVWLPLVACVAAGCASDPDISEIRVIERLGGRVKLDDGLPGEPVTVVWLMDTKASDDDLDGVARLTNLRELYLSRTQITDEGLRRLSSLAALQKLDVVDTAGLARLKAFPQLEELYLTGTQVTDAGISHLAPLRELRNLDVFDTPITDRSLRTIASLHKLQRLGLSGTKVTDASLGPISRLGNLREIFLEKTRVTEAGVRSLRARMPHATVYY